MLITPGGERTSGLAGNQTSRRSISWQLDRSVCDGWYTFAGFSVRLQSEANGTAAADSCHWIVTRAITAAVVHCAGLCKETSSQTNPTGKHKVAAVLTYLVNQQTRMPVRSHQENIRSHTIIYSINFVTLQAINRTADQSGFQWSENKDRMTEMKQLNEIDRKRTNVD